MNSVLDASALLAHLKGEKGAEVVAEALSQGAAMSVVNLAEVLSKLAEWGQPPEAALERMQQAGLLHTLLKLEPLSEKDTLQVATWRPLTKALGLSLGDRCCLALAHRLALPALTSDRDWQQANVPVNVKLIR
ncbi:MAG: type II toxin-antitoxin system VapC family toxin [Deinococcota bacterium]|nr:type II toxin-antitoxin system VapC family toxin [Deinococcota bacterium]